MKFVEKVFPDKDVLIIFLVFFIISQFLIFLKNVYPILISYHPYALLKVKEGEKYFLFQKEGLRYFYDLNSKELKPLPILNIQRKKYNPLKEGTVKVKLQGEILKLTPYREVFGKILLRKLSKNLKMTFVFLLGLLVLLILTNLDYRFLKEKKVVYTLITTSIFLLGLLLVKKKFSTSNMPSRWLFGTSIQPSELSKLVLIIFLAKYFSDKGSIQRLRYFAWVSFIVLLHAFFIALQPDIGMAFFVILLALTLTIFGGVRKSIFILSLVIFGIFGIFFMLLFSEHIKRRFAGWLDPFSDPFDKGYQIIKSLQAIINGGFLGEGFGKGLFSATYIRESDTDYVISLLIENFGVLGFLFLLFVQLILMIKLLRYARLVYGTFERLVIIGIVANFIYSVFMNYAMAFNLIPPKGIALPFISYGSSNLLANFIALGLVGSIYRRNIKILNEES